MNAERTDGIMPLVCAVCGEAVGVINERSLAVMIGAEEIYICKQCEALPSTVIERILDEQPPQHYEQITRQRIIEDGLTLPTSLRVDSMPAYAG
ncbi:MAG: hypothetical protein JXR84_08435 [Anaerolineae bacterium]|nr:hypothetical protein [Anaerolineae bacterium]